MAKVFLSHSSRDKNQVLDLAHDLQDRGVDVWLDEWEILVGDSIVQKIQKGLGESDYLALWITKHAITSHWVEREWHSKFMEEVSKKTVLVLPLLAENVPLPLFLQDKRWADFRSNYKLGLSQILERIEYDRVPVEGYRQTKSSCWESYGWIFNVDEYRIPYIPLINNPKNDQIFLHISDIEIRKDLNDYPLPEAFREIRINRPFWQNQACRLSHYNYLKEKKFLSVTLSETTYENYLKSGEVLDFPMQHQSSKTFRDEFGMLIRSGERNLRPFPLSNICGAGLFILTSDNFIVASRHPLESHVYPGRMTYSASGIMLWGATPDPFHAITIKAFQEIKHQVNLQNLCLIDFGADARKLYFQFSFIDEADIPLREIKRNCNDGLDLVGLPAEPDSIARYLINEPWEPAAEASLIFYLIKRFGYNSVFEELKHFRSRWTEKGMREEWDFRAALPGLLPDMSVRYPPEELQKLSDFYIERIITFLGDDIKNKDVIEIGCGTGRISERIIDSVKDLTCIDLSEAMIRHHKTRLGESASKINYFHGLVQNYPPQNHEIVICSLVLIHNVDNKMFQSLVNKISAITDVVYIFEDVTQNRTTGPHTKLRSIKEIENILLDFVVAKKEIHKLHEDEIVFFKLVRNGMSNS